MCLPKGRRIWKDLMGWCLRKPCVWCLARRHIEYISAVSVIQAAKWLCLGLKAAVKCVFVTQSCPALCDPMDCSPPGSSVHGILQARRLEWVAMPFFSRGFSWLRYRTQVSCTAEKCKLGVKSSLYNSSPPCFIYMYVRSWHPVPSLHGK